MTVLDPSNPFTVHETFTHPEGFDLLVITHVRESSINLDNFYVVRNEERETNERRVAIETTFINPRRLWENTT